MPNKPPSQIKYSEQNILNNSFDEKYNNLTFELVGEDSSLEVLRRFQLNNRGEQIVDFGQSNLSAFGDLVTVENFPILSLDFVYGINTQTGVSTTANSATVDTDSGRLRLQCGTNSAGSAIFNSRRVAKYRAGQGITARFTPLFATPIANNTQIVGMGNADDGYFFGYSGTSFGILHRIRGSDTWVTQANWNGDKCDGTGDSLFSWDKTKGVPVMIRYPYLGYGNIMFFVQNPVNSRWILCHTIRYANTVATTQVGNPSLFFYAQNLNSGNTTNKIMYVGSVGVFINGLRTFVGNPKWASDSNKTGVTTEANLLTVRNATTYNGITNRALIRLTSLAMSSSAASGVGNIRLKINSTLGGTPSYTPISGSTADNGVTITSGNSVSSVDVAGTTITGGSLILSLAIDNPNSQLIDLLPYEIFVAPGEILTLSGFSSISSQMGVALNWTEDL